MPRYPKIVSAVVVAALLSVAAGAQAAVVGTYTSVSAFEAALSSSSVMADFSSVSANSTPLSYSLTSNGFSSTFTSDPHIRNPVPSWQELYFSGNAVSENFSDASLIITFTGGNPTAIGGDFYVGDGSGMATLPVTLTFADGSATTFTPISTTDFRGFTTDSPIASVTVSFPFSGEFSYVNNFVVGTASAVPEPASLATVGIAGVALLARRRR